MPKYAVAVEGSQYEVEAPDEQTAWNWAVYTHQNQPKAQPPAPFSLADVGLTGAAGAVGATRAVLQAFGPETPGVQTLGEFQQSLLGMRTPERQAEVARRAALEQQAAKTGTAAEEIGAFLGGIKEAPIQSIAQGVGSTVPALLTGAAALVVGAPLGIATAVGIGTRFLFGALQGAGEVKGSIYDNVFRELKAQGVPEDQAKIQAEAAQDYIGNNTDNIFVGAGLGALAGGTGAERVLGNYVAKKMGVDLASGAAKKEAEGLIMRGVKEALKEGIPEGLQGGQEQFASNVALAREGFEVPEFEGVLGSAARDAAIGALTGGVVSPFGRQRAEAPVPEAERPLEKLAPEQLTALRDQYIEAETELNRLAEEAKVSTLTPEAKQAAIEAFISYKNNTFAPLRAEFSRYRTQIEALTPKTEQPTIEPGAEPAVEPSKPIAPITPTTPMDEAGLRDLNNRYQEAKKQLDVLKTITSGRDLTPEQRKEAVNAYKDYKINIFNPLQQEYGKNRQAILALPKVSTLTPKPPAPPTAGVPPASTEPTIDQPSGEPPATTVEPISGLPTPPETREFQIAKPKEQIAQDVSKMTIPELSRWAVLNAPNTPAQQFAIKAFDRINQYADRGMFPGKIKVLNGGNRSSEFRGKVRYKYYTDPKLGFDMSLTLNGIPSDGKADFLTGTQYSTILHELIHVATTLELQFNPNSKPVKELNSLYIIVKKQMMADINSGKQHPAFDAVKRGANTMLNVRELVAWGLTDKNFQDYLATIKVGEKKTAFSKFVEIMRKLLNVNPEFESALDSLLRSSESILSAPVSKMEKATGVTLKGAQAIKGAPAPRVELPTPPKPPEAVKPPAPPKPPETEEPPAPGGIKLEPGKPFTRPKLPPLGPKPPELDISNVQRSKKPPEQGGRDPQVQAAAMLLAEGKMTREEYEKYVDHYRAIYPINIDALLPPSTVEAMRGALRGDVAKARLNTAIKDGTRVGLRMDLPALDKGVPVVSIHEGRPNADKKGRPYRSAGDVISYASTGYIKNVFFAPRAQDLSLKMGYMPEGKNPLQTAEGEWVNMTPEDVYKRVKELKNDPAWVQVGFDPHRHGYFYDRKTREPVAKADELFQVGNFLLAKNVKYAPKEEFLYETAERPATVEMEVSPLGFFSALTEQAKKLNIKATEPQNWKTALKGLVNRGLVKNEEIEWTGVNDWLDLQQGKVTKEQLISYLRDNGVKVEEVVLGKQPQGTKYETYTLPGGENYREVLLTLPTKAAPVEGKVVKDDKDAQYPWAIIVNGKEVNRVKVESVANDVLEEELAIARKQIGSKDKSVFRSGHWDQPNVLAHIRMNDRTDADGNKVLFIEEIQSDWGQERKKNLQMAAESGSQMVREGAEMKTPAAPFITKTEGWLNLALKRIMVMAAEGGYDKVAFVNGDQSANRYDLSKQVGSVYYSPGDRAGVGKGTLIAMPVGKTITNSNRPVLEKHDVGPEEIEAYVGKEIAKNLLASPIVDGFHSVSGEGLKVGGEGMKAFYDKIVPLAVKKLLPKMGGGQMGTVNIQTRDNRLAVVERDDGFRIMDLNANIGSDLLDGVYSTRADAEAAMNAMLRGNQLGFDITPSMMGKVPISVELFEQGDIGPRAVDIIGKLGMGVQPPQPGFIQQSKANLKFALENPKLTRESAKKATIGFLDKIETSVFSSSSAFDNQLRRAVADDIKGNEEVIGMLIDASQSQAVHADALASQFIIEGGLRYDEEYKKWVAYKEPDNFVELGKQVNEIAKKYNISEDEARRVTHTYFLSKRLRSLQERNAKDKERIEELKAERDVAKTKDEKAKINREIERLKDREAFIHMDDPEIDLGLKLGEMMPELEGVTKTWNGIRRNARRVLVNSGLWTEEYADQMLDVIDYVPFYREVQLEEGQGPREFVRGLQVAAKEHRLKGTNKPVNDILDNMVRWTQYAVNRSVRNDKAVRMVDAALKIDMGDGTKMAERVEKAERGMNIVRIWRDGQQELYNMADPLFADAFTGIQSVALDMYPMASKFANTLRDSVVLFPLFSVAQVPQDAFAAMFSSGLQPQYALRIPILAVKEFIKTLNKSSQTHQILKKFGAVGVRDFNSTVIRDDAEVFAGIKAPPGVKAKIKEYLQHIAMSADNSIRQAVYEASVQQGLTKAEALEKAFEVINFRRRGTNKMFQLAGQTIPFFYAYLAAQRVAYNTLTGTGISPQDRKAAWKTLMYTSASVMTLSFLYAMMAADDEDYKNTPAAIRDRTLTIPGTGGLRIPLRTDFFLFPKIVAEHTYLLLTDKGYEDPAKFRKSLANALGEALFSPTLVPQVVKPIVEAGINYDFFQGRPILGQYEKQKEWSRQFNETTSEFSKLMGQTGLVSPIMADHLIRGFLGTTGGLFLWFTNTAINKSGLMGVEAPEKTWREAVEAIPGTSGFLKRTNESALRNDFYELREKVSVAAATFNDIKKNNPQGIKEYLEDEKRMARLIVSKQVENVNKRLAELRARIRQITEAPTTMMTASEKGEAIRQLRQIEQQIYEAINVKGMREKAKL